MLTYEEAALLMMAEEGEDSTVGSSQIYRDVLENGIPAGTIKITDRFKYVAMVWEDKKHYLGQSIEPICHTFMDEVRYEPYTDSYYPNGYRIQDVLSGHLSFGHRNASRTRTFFCFLVLYDGGNPVLVRRDMKSNHSYYIHGEAARILYNKTLNYYDPNHRGVLEDEPPIQNIFMEYRVSAGDIMVKESAGIFSIDVGKLNDFNESNHSSWWSHNYGTDYYYMKFGGTVPLMKEGGTTNYSETCGGFEINGSVPMISYLGKKRPLVCSPFDPDREVEDIRVEPELDREYEYHSDWIVTLYGPQGSGGFYPYLHGEDITIYSDKSLNSLADIEFQIWKSLVEEYNDGVITTVEKDIRFL